MIDGAPLSITGLIDFMRDHALREQRIKRLNIRTAWQMPGKLHRPREETRIEQMQNRVFNPTDILIYIHPIGDIFGRGGLRGMRRGKAGKIPRGINECVHRVGFTQSRFSAGRAGTIAPCRVAIQRISGFVKADIIGQDHR